MEIMDYFKDPKFWYGYAGGVASLMLLQMMF